MTSFGGRRLLKETPAESAQLSETATRHEHEAQELVRQQPNIVELISANPPGDAQDQKPKAPKSIAETGLDSAFLSALALKHILSLGEFTVHDLAARLKLPGQILESTIDSLRREKHIQVKGADDFAKSFFRYGITETGKAAAVESLKVCRYVGPAPVTLSQYQNRVSLQTIRNIIVNDERVKEAFSALTVNEAFLNRLGPAVGSGHPIFLYGPPGNGKTSIAETIGGVLPGTVFVPHALVIDGQIITVYDAITQQPIPEDSGNENPDRRWVEIQRPVVIAGGELTLDMLDLQFNPIAKTYQAPLQMKANNGLFIIDDFGRQRMRPDELFNRWIVNLERHVDFLSLHTGMKFDSPFDQLVIFSTNQDPKLLVDEAFLRRIRYKFKVDYPTLEEFQRIFQRVCADQGIEFKAEQFGLLITEYYLKNHKKPSACQARDLIDHIVNECRYYDKKPELTQETLQNAWKSYFL